VAINRVTTGGGFGGYAGDPGALGDTFYTPDPPPAQSKDCAHDLAGVALGLVGMAGSILSSDLAGNPAVAAGAAGFLAGTVEGVVFAGIILAELPVAVVAGLAIAAGIAIASLALYLACQAG